MTVVVTCKCGKTMNLGERDRGRTIVCPKCHAKMVVPGDPSPYVQSRIAAQDDDSIDRQAATLEEIRRNVAAIALLAKIILISWLIGAVVFVAIGLWSILAIAQPSAASSSSHPGGAGRTSNPGPYGGGF